MQATSTGTVEIVTPRATGQPHTAAGGSGEEWLCGWCHQPVARERDREEVQGAAEHVFTNPAGQVFHILLFGKVRGCRNTGLPTLQHTWFAGCAWSCCLCARCGAHLGWFYTGQRTFAALIRDRIVRAALVNN